MICSNDVTKEWLINIVPKLEGLWDGADIKTVVMGTPPKLIRATIVMPAPTYEPTVLFQIITRKIRLKQHIGNTSQEPK